MKESDYQTPTTPKFDKRLKNHEISDFEKSDSFSEISSNYKKIQDIRKMNQLDGSASKIDYKKLYDELKRKKTTNQREMT